VTNPDNSDRARALVDRLARGDRSTALVLHALISAADPEGVADFDAAARVYRDDYLSALRATGRDAEREAGRLSLDEVRKYLESFCSRLVGEGVLSVAPHTAEAGSKVKFSACTWAAIVGERDSVAAALRVTGEQPVQSVDGRRSETPVQTPAVIAGGSVLEATGLVKTYRRRRVVNDVALRLQQGEIVGLLGPNGAGKTTTFYMIVGLIEPQAGKIVMDGVDITKMPMYKRARQGIGYLSQEPSIFRKLSVEDNILAILETLHLSSSERRSRLETLLDELSIKHLRNNKAFALSGGERRRLEITRALVTQPKFMMLDEPFAGVDPIAVHDI